MKKSILIISGILLLIVLFTFSKNKAREENSLSAGKFWQMQAIDTVKYSRDVAGQHLKNPEYDTEIEKQVSKIASTGATHIALGTPYDERFVPFLKRWVQISRKYGLKVWYRGNFSGWEGWFDYDGIDREEHKALLEEFILANGNLFEDGDIFTSCTECENGGAGDPRRTGDVEGFRNFLIEEYAISRDTFRRVSKNVESNYYPMNFDVASLIMNKETTKALGGIVVIDHYVGTPERTNNDSTKLAENSGGKIVIGEFGAPIPDIHGEMTEEEQAEWIDRTLYLLNNNPHVVGINYWTGFGGSTKLWNSDGTERLVVDTLKKYYDPQTIRGAVIDETGKPVPEVKLASSKRFVMADREGRFAFPYLENSTLTVSAAGFSTESYISPGKTEDITIVLKRDNPGIIYRLQKMIRNVIVRD
jgi:hypothetical protein